MKDKPVPLPGTPSVNRIASFSGALESQGEDMNHSKEELSLLFQDSKVHVETLQQVYGWNRWSQVGNEGCPGTWQVCGQEHEEWPLS